MKLRPSIKQETKSKMNIYDFSDRLNSDRNIRENFVSEYIDYLARVTDVVDIISEWKDMMYEKYISEIRQNGADNLVEDVAYNFPSWLENQFKVDVSLVQA